MVITNDVFIYGYIDDGTGCACVIAGDCFDLLE